MSTIRAIYGHRKELGLDDDTARDFYEREVGKRHLTDMTPGEQVRVLQALQAQKRGGGAVAQKGLGGPYAKKLQALWIAGFNLGVVRVRTDEALLSFLERQTGLKHTRFLRDAGDARRAIEALKAWIGREAGVEWAEHEEPADAVLAAQGRALGFDRLDEASGDAELAGWQAWRRGELEAPHIRALSTAMGERIRRGK